MSDGKVTFEKVEDRGPYVRQGDDGKWYYMDETWDLCGPYATEAEAQTALDAYCKDVLGHPD